MNQQFFGKYRGKVENNIDPLRQGRIQVSVPAVLGEGRLSWAIPCIPYAGSGVGFFAIPPRDANVWIEFEGGDTSYPIWSGCFWDAGKAPDPRALAMKKVWKTDTASITVDDTPGAGGIRIETTSGMKIQMDAGGIEINNGRGASIKLSGPQVSLNGGALEVT